MVGERGESETEHFYRQQESATSSSYASPAHRSHLQPQPRQVQNQQPRENQLPEPRQPQPVQLPEYKVVNVKEPPKSYDSSFHCIHTSIEIVVVVSLICATSELVLGFWVFYILSRTSSHTASSKYITIGVGMFIAQSVRVFALLTWLKSSKQELTKAYSATTLCTVVSILVLLPIGCLVLFVAVVVFEFVVFHVRPQIEVLESFMMVATFDLLFSICYGSIVACCFQNRLQKRQIYLRTSQINIRPPPPPPPTRAPSTTPSTTLSTLRNQPFQQQPNFNYHQHHHPPRYDFYDDHHHDHHVYQHHRRPLDEFNFHHQFHHLAPHYRNNSSAVAYV